MMPVSNAYNQDCLIGMKEFPDKFFELAVVDPPYGINAPNMQMGNNAPSRNGKASVAVTLKNNRLQRLNGGGDKLKDRILNTSVIKWDYEKPPPEYFTELQRVSKNQIIWGGNYFDLPPTRGIVCWDKCQPWENFSQWEMGWTSFDCPAVMIYFSNTGGANQETKIHPTQKPIAVYKELLRRFAKPNDKILDTHLGSQSSRIAAYKLGFDFWGYELDEDYFKQGCDRFEKSIAEPLFDAPKTFEQGNFFTQKP